MPNIDTFFETVKLPSISQVAQALIQTLHDESASILTVRDLLAKDPALSAKLLRLANSAQFGLPRGVGTIEDAIAMVGIDRVRTLALGACMSGAFPSMGGLDRNAFWSTSMACAGYAQWLAEHLEKEGIRSAAIHGNKSQGARTKALADFKAGSMRVLVATDIASRGLDIDQLPYVVNYELPNVPESYVHRIGRTGRAGKKGIAVSLVCIDERDFLRDIERLLKREIPKQLIPGFEPDPRIKAEPIVMGRQNFRRR